MANKNSVLVSIACGVGFGALLYSDGAAQTSAFLAGVVAAEVVYLVLLFVSSIKKRTSLITPVDEHEEEFISHHCTVEPEIMEIRPVQRSAQPTKAVPIKRRAKQRVTKINPEYYRPDVVLSRFTPVNSTVIMGVGCAGINAVNHMVESGVRGADTITIDTDLQKLHHSKSDCSLFIGDDKGRVAELIAEAMDDLEQVYQHADTVILLVGMGGKTGTVAAPMLSRAAKAAGKVVHLFAIEPFLIEGDAKVLVAATILKQLESELDSVVTLSNNELDDLFTSDGNMVKAFNAANEVWRRLVTRAVEPEVILH